MKTKITHPFVIAWGAPNPDYPSCPLGMRVSDLPRGWASAGHVSRVYTESLQVYGNAKLTPQAAEDIRTRHVNGEPGSHIAHAYGVHPSQVSRILSGKAWT